MVCVCSPSILSDDTGRVFNLKVDPPVVIDRAVRDSVRRWRLSLIILKHPACSPEVPDYIDPSMAEQWFYSDGLVPQGTIDLASSMHRLINKGGMKSKAFEPWRPEHKASLVSAFTGGQWPQARQAACKTWTDDPHCQLCRSEVGTLLHRRYCISTMPTGGWPLPHGDASKFISTVSLDRKRVALTNGLLLARVIVRPAPVVSDFEWLLMPAAPFPSSATWYIDGSLTHPLFKAASRTGFGVAVVDYDGTLVAYGHGHPPDWITDASGAEAWAFFHVVSSNMWCPRVITDCSNILRLLELGHKAANDASRPLARISGLIPALLVVMTPTHCPTSR